MVDSRLQLVKGVHPAQYDNQSSHQECLVLLTRTIAINWVSTIKPGEKRDGYRAVLFLRSGYTLLHYDKLLLVSSLSSNTDEGFLRASHQTRLVLSVPVSFSRTVQNLSIHARRVL